MQVGIGRRDSRRLRNLALVAGLVVISSLLWALVLVEASRRAPVGSFPLTLSALVSLIALGLAISMWRSSHGAGERMLAVPALRNSLATHQAGHILAAYNADPTRIRRASLAEGCHLHTPDTPAVTESALRAEITVALAGMVAEEILSGESGAYAAGDLVRATDIAADMVGYYGMAGSPVSLRSAARGRRDFVAWVLDDPRARKDLEMILRDIKQDTVRSMLEKRHVAIALRDALLQHGRLSPAQIRAIILNADRRRHDDDKVLVDLRIVSSKPAAQVSS